jgi:two-component system phosphate regulon sensor histidine kinase PhoR
MICIVVVSLSVVLQLVAAALALRLTRITGRVSAWSLVAAAFLLMTVRRIMLLISWAGGEVPSPSSMISETLGLVISILIVSGMAGISPLFLGLKAREEELKDHVATQATAEVELRSQRDFISAVLQTAGALVVVVDSDGNIVRFNRACEETTGWRAVDVLGHSVWDLFIVPDERESVENMWHSLKSGVFPISIENHWLTRQGERRLIAWTNTCIMDSTGHMGYTIATGIDVTEQRRTLERSRLDEQRLMALLQLSEMSGARLQEITDYVLEAAVTLTRSTIGYLAFASEDESVLTMHSWSHTAMDQCAIIDKPLVYPVATTGLWGEAVRQRKPVITNDYQAASPLKKGYPEGHVAMTRHMNVPVFDGERIVAVAGVGNKEEPYDDSDVMQLRLLMDDMWRILSRMRAAEELQRAHDELELRIQERTAELVRSNQELEQFAYAASHDLQEPLRKILAFSDRVSAKAGEALDTEARDYLARMQNAAQRMQTLINDLLAYSRVTTRANPFTELDLNALVQEVLQDLELAVERSHAEVSVAPLPTLWGDATQIRLLLQNLIANALKFQPEGQTPKVRVEGELLDGQEGDGTVVLTISDNGIGFEDRFAERIFGVFHRLHARGEYEGTGIGLAICRKIVERHRGQIMAHGVPGEGSVFTVMLPQRPPQAGEPA